VTSKYVFRDIESRSAIDLKDVGGSVYAQHPSTEVLVVAYAVDDGPVKVWRPGLPVPREFKRPNVVGVAHNCSFEMAVERHILGPRFGFPVIPVERNVCTMAQANACALPGKLEKAAEVLHLKHQKDAMGARLMKAMAKPRKALKGEDPNRIHWIDDEESRARLEEYCATDVATTRELFHTIPRLPEAEQRLWVLDQRINDHGFHLDAKLARAAHCVVLDAFPAIDSELAELTGGAVTAASQVPKLKLWLRRNGVDVGEQLTKGTIEELLERDLPAAARRAIELRALGAQAAVKKVSALLDRREADGRIRGSFIFHAAGTGRFSSRGAGIHNLKRPAIAGEDLARAIAVIGEGDYQLACQKFDNPLSVVGDLIRSMICAPQGCVLMGADYSGIEARVTAWLAGEESKLEVFRKYDAGLGPDPYLVAAGRIYNKDPATIDPKSFERVVGKASELALGFNAGIGALKKFLPADSPFDDRELERIVHKWRRGHPNIERLWNDIGNCASKAVRNPGEVWTCHGIEMESDADPFLWVTLPSGRRLAYPHARISRILPGRGHVIEHERGRPSLLFKDNSQGQWRDVRAWPGLLVENLVQAVARDLLAEAMTRLDAAGFKIVTHTHDAVVVELKKPSAKFLELMVEPPAWAEGLPITAKTWKGHRNQ
jgi:DNA polymerase bacteriophage-type